MINLYILECQHTKCDCWLWKVLWFSCVFWKFSYIIIIACLKSYSFIIWSSKMLWFCIKFAYKENYHSSVISPHILQRHICFAPFINCRSISEKYFLFDSFWIVSWIQNDVNDLNFIQYRQIIPTVRSLFSFSLFLFW